MIISASRQTDIPAYYPDWFYNRIRKGYVCVRNPMNFHQVSRISLSPDVVDGIVFWTKNPLPLMSRLEELRAYPFITITKKTRRSFKLTVMPPRLSRGGMTTGESPSRYHAINLTLLRCFALFGILAHHLMIFTTIFLFYSNFSYSVLRLS